MTEIIPNLFLGNKNDSTNHQIYDVIINCTKNLPFHGDAEQIRIPVDDTHSDEDMHDMLKYLPFSCSKIGASLKDGLRVLVHCNQGAQRSPCVVAAYIMASLEMSADDSIKFVRQRKIDAFFYNVNFFKSLRSWESMITPSKTTPLDSSQPPSRSRQIGGRKPL